MLREEWGFKGAVVSDYFAIREMVTRHKMFADIKDAAVRAIDAGVDIETPDGEAYVHLPELVRAGKVTAGADRRRGAAHPDDEVPGRAVRKPLCR